MKSRSKHMLVVALAIVTMMVLTACTAVQVSGNLVLKEDGSGIRQITGSIAKQDYQDGYGSAYYYFKQHGAELENYIRSVYEEKVPGSTEWLKVAVDDSGADWEFVTLTFDFSSFEEYQTRLKALAYDAEAAASYVDPTFSVDENGQISYQESTAVMTAIFKSIQKTFMADDTMFDPTCTKDGTALNDGSADGQLEEYGVELMKPENGAAMTIQAGTNEAAAVEAVDGMFTLGQAPSQSGETGDAKDPKDHETSKVLHYEFNESLANVGTAAENDLTYGAGSTEGGPVFVDGIDGKAFLLDGATYLASPNKNYNYDEMTVSFYYRMDEYTQTDTGANMILVPAGLGALGSGVIDIEFIKEADADGIQLLSKMNSSNWQQQDKLYSEGYLLEAHKKEWHCYTLVFQNEYDDEGSIEDAFVYMYIDGKLASRSRLAVAAGLTYSLGIHDDGAAGDPNGGFNVGGYFENGTVKRGSTGAIDNLMVFDGALNEEEINTLCYTVKVEKEYDPDTVDEVPGGDSQIGGQEEPTAVPTATPQPTATPEPAEADGESSNTTMIVVGIVIVLVIAAGAAVLILRKKKSE